MSGYLFLVPISLALALVALGAFLWSLRHEQYDDLDGAAERVLFADDRPIVDRPVDDRGGVGVNAGSASAGSDGRDTSPR